MSSNADNTGQPPKGLEDVFDFASVLAVAPDPHQTEHLEILVHHPRFEVAVEELHQELLGQDSEFRARVRFVSEVGRGHEIPAMIRVFAEKWGLSPAAAAHLAVIGKSGLHEVRSETHPFLTWDRLASDGHEIMAWESSTDYTIRIPRPLTPERATAVKKWLTSRSGKNAEVGPLEKAWSRDGKLRYGKSYSLVESLEWFDRWNNQQEEPAAIWQDILEAHPKLGFEMFHKRLVRVWKRMRDLSSDGVRPDRPSKKPA